MAVTFDISMSLDGYVTGPRPRAEAPLGDDDGRLHDWLIPYADFTRPMIQVRTSTLACLTASTNELARS